MSVETLNLLSLSETFWKLQPELTPQTPTGLSVVLLTSCAGGVRLLRSRARLTLLEDFRKHPREHESEHSV